jgi:hypothetical protein
MCTYFQLGARCPLTLKKGINVGIGNHFMLGHQYFVKSYANSTCAKYLIYTKIKLQGILQKEFNVVTILTNQKLENTQPMQQTLV